MSGSVDIWYEGSRTRSPVLDELGFGYMEGEPTRKRALVPGFQPEYVPDPDLPILGYECATGVEFMSCVASASHERRRLRNERVRRMRSQGVTVAAIAARVGVDPKCVYQILSKDPT